MEEDMFDDKLVLGEDVGIEGMIFDQRFYAWDSVGFETYLRPEHKSGFINLGINYNDLGISDHDFLSGKIRIIMKYSQFCRVTDCIDYKGILVPERMYFNARYALFFSIDQGMTWKFGGIPIGPSKWNDYGPDSGVIWSGSFLPSSDGTVLCAYTSVPKKPPIGSKTELSDYVLQNIMGAKSSDGGFTFVKIKEPLISAIRDYEKLREVGYYFGNSEMLGLENDPDGTHMTLRDMQLVRRDDGSLWGYFAAKSVSEKNKSGVEPCVGQVRFRNSKRLEEGVEVVGRPMLLPNEENSDFNQLECPNILKNKDGETIVVASLAQHWEIGQSERNAVKEVKVYKADGLEDGSLGDLRAYGNADEDGNILLTNREHGLYALCTIFNDNSNRIGIYDCAAFQVKEDHKFQYPSIELNVNGRIPSIQLPDLEKYNELVKGVLLESVES